MAEEYTNYKRLNRTPVHHGAIIDYYTDEVQLPDGRTEMWDFIDHKGAAAPFHEQFKYNGQKSIGVSLSIPLYNHLQKFSNLSRKKTDYKIAAYEYDETCRAVENAVYAAYDDANSAEKSLQAAQKSAVLNQKYYEAAQKKFDLGTISYIDFNEVYNKYLESQAKYYNALYSYMIKTAVVEYYKGTPYIEQF